MTTSNFRTISVILALWLFATFWNIDKAFHIDDAGHLEIAQWIQAYPTKPMSGWVNWSGAFEPISKLNQPHLYFYLMAGWGSLFGYSEISMHLLLAMFSLWAIVGFFRLASLFEPKYAEHITALFALSPAFVVGQNSMVDVPLLAIWIQFYLTLLNQTHRPQVRYLFASLLCAAALLMKYTSLVLLPAMVLHILLNQRYKDVAWMLVPIGFLFAWSIFNIYDYGGIHIFDRPRRIKTSLNYLISAIGWVATLGAILPFSIIAFISEFRQHQSIVQKFIWANFCMMALLVPIAVSMSVMFELPSLQLNIALFSSFFVSGLGVIIISYSIQKASFISHGFGIKNAMILYWCVSSMAFVVLLAPFMATRHVLLAMPALMLIIYPRVVRTAQMTKIYATGLILTILTTAVLAKADAWYAGIYKNAAIEIANEIPKDRQTWFMGHWGWQWYAQQSGMRQWAPNIEKPVVGDYMVIPLNVDGGDVPGNLDLSELKEIVIYRSDWYQHYATINLYISPWLPWGYSDHPMERIKIYRIDGIRS
jgi:hypothetical protein